MKLRVPGWLRPLLKWTWLIGLLTFVATFRNTPPAPFRNGSVVLFRNGGCGHFPQRLSGATHDGVRKSVAGFSFGNSQPAGRHQFGGPRFQGMEVATDVLRQAALAGKTLAGVVGVVTQGVPKPKRTMREAPVTDDRGERFEVRARAVLRGGLGAAGQTFTGHNPPFRACLGGGTKSALRESDKGSAGRF